MKAMILAAGRGERMRPLTDCTPKPLLMAGAHPLIVWHILRLAEGGIRQIVINHAWLGEHFERTLGDGSRFGVQISYSSESIGLESAGGIATAIPLLGDAPFLVINGDILLELDFAGFASANLARLQHDNNLAHLLLVPNPAHHLQGDFALASDGYVGAEPKLGNALTFAGVGLYQPKLFADTPPHQAAKLAPLLRKSMLNRQVTGELHQGLWLDVGTEQRLQQANIIASKWLAKA